MRINQRYLESYFNTCTRLNPLYPTTAFFTPGEVFSSAAVLPIAEFHQTRFYREWMLRQSMIDSLAVNLEKSVTTVATLAVIRGEREGFVDEAAMRRMRLVAPHMMRATAIGHVVTEKMEKKAA